MKTLDFEWKILQWFDSFKCDFLNLFNQYVSLIFGSIGLIVILMVVYWICNKEKGYIIAYNLFLAIILNNILKTFFMRRRPFEHTGYEHLRKLDVAKDGATGSSFPSGHAMNSSCLYSSLTLNFKAKRFLWLQIVCIVLIILIAISRLYLGVHFFTDVVCGVVLGILITILFTFIQKVLAGKKNILYIITIILFLPCLFFDIFARDFYKGYGLMIGFMIANLLEARFVKFDINVTGTQKLIRLLIGAIVVGSIYLVYEVVPSSVHNNLYFTLFIHFLLSFCGFFVVPLIFKFIEKPHKKAYKNTTSKN